MKKIFEVQTRDAKGWFMDLVTKTPEKELGKVIYRIATEVNCDLCRFSKRGNVISAKYYPTQDEIFFTLSDKDVVGGKILLVFKINFNARWFFRNDQIEIHSDHSNFILFFDTDKVSLGQLD